LLQKDAKQKFPLDFERNPLHVVHRRRNRKKMKKFRKVQKRRTKRRRNIKKSTRKVKNIKRIKKEFLYGELIIKRLKVIGLPDLDVLNLEYQN
jgi:hypothetical protein